MDYEDPALEGEIITFTCSPGLELSGPISAMCMRSGEWEPDPGEVNCTGVLNQMTAGTPTILRMPQIFCVIIFYYSYRSLLFIYILKLNNHTYFFFTVDMFVPATCSSPPYVLQLNDTVKQ